MLSKKERQFLQELNEQKVRFMVVGLSAAVLQGAVVATQDIDLWFQELADSRIQRAIEKVGGFYIPPFPQMQNPPRFAGEEFQLLDIVTDMCGLKCFEDEYKHAKLAVVDGIRLKVLPLARVIHSKKMLGRLKDKAALPALEAALHAIKKTSSRYLK